MSQGMWICGLGYAGALSGGFDCALQQALVHVMLANDTRTRIGRHVSCDVNLRSAELPWSGRHNRAPPLLSNAFRQAHQAIAEVNL
jgi:hypothetical protein